MKNSNRNIILFGAGAVIDWGGPNTDELTDIVVTSGFETKEGEKITDRIKSILENKGHTVNFETILSVIEEIIIYYSGASKLDLNKSFLTPFLIESDLLSQMLNYSLKGNTSNYYSLDIPKFESSSSKQASPGTNPNQFFFELLLVELHTFIGNRISKYNFYTKKKRDIVESSEKQSLNNVFANWIKAIKAKGDIIRLYTLNYDRLSKVILENRNIRVFEGFNSNTILSNDENIEPDLKKIITDNNCLCSYNLHGCINWELKILNNHKSYIPTLKNGEKFAFNYPDFPNIEIEKGKPSIYTNVIAGYQKAQRSALAPYKQMQAAFDRDCLIANNIIIVGYSFSDEHINESIRMALLYNGKAKIHIIDCGFNNSLDLKYFSEFSNLITYERPENITDNVYKFGNTYAYIYKFQDFLLDKIELIE